PSYIYSIIGISLVLFLLGTIGWLAINGRALSRFFKEQVEVQVILHDKTRDSKTQELAAILEKQPFVINVNIITKEEAAEQFAKEWEEDFTELLDFNPLYTSINLKMPSAYVNSYSMDKTKQYLQKSNIILEADYTNVMVNQINSNFRKIGIVLGVITLILFIAVIIIIDNTVRFSMFSNR